MWQLGTEQAGLRFMKPQLPPFSRREFDGQSRCRLAPKSLELGNFFQSGSGFLLGYSPGNDGRRRFHNLSREFLLEAAREQKREMLVLSLIVLVSAWPVISMIVTVVQLICTRHPNFD